MVRFGERLKELMEENNTDVKTLATYLNTQTSTIYQWRRGERSTYLNTIIKIADYYHCSLDYLVGKTDEYEIMNYQDCPPIGDQLKKVLKERNVSQYRIIKDLHISSNNLLKWYSGEAVPHIMNISKIADYLNVSIDYLVGREP